MDFSYQLAVDPANPEWLRDRFIGWKNFDEKSIAKIRAGAAFVVFADISAFYENIDISLLISDLKATGAPKPAVDQLSICLNKWAQVSGRGIPQGQTPSDVLAKLYLNTLDQNLKNMGYQHLRYVDDFRVFCANEVEAKRFLIDLCRFLRKRGLNLQSAKCEILPAGEAHTRIEEVTVALRRVSQEFIAEVTQRIGLVDPYVGVNEADNILAHSTDDTPIEVIRRAYKQYFIENQTKFNKTLFRFLLRRLGKQSDNFASAHTLGLLEARPEETQAILQYLTSVSSIEALEPQIIELLRSRRVVYDYQVYQIMACFLDNSVDASAELMNLARVISFSNDRPRYVRTVCRALLGRFGTSS